MSDDESDDAEAQWLKSFSHDGNQDLVFALLNKAMKQGKDLVTVAREYYRENIAPRMEARKDPAQAGPVPAPATGKLAGRLGDEHWTLEGPVRKAFYCDEGRSAAILCVQKDLVIFTRVDARTGRTQKILRVTQEKLQLVTLSPDGAHFAVQGEDARIHLWSTSTGEKVRELEALDETEAGQWSTDRLEFSQDGRHLFACHRGRMFRWDVSSGERTWMRPCPTHVGHLIPSPDGQQVAWITGDDLHVLRVGGIEARVIPQAWMSHWHVASMGWSPDGDRIALVACFRVRIVLVATGEVKQRNIPSNNVNGISMAHTFSPDGKYLVVGGDDIDIWFFVLDSDAAPGSVGYSGYHLRSLSFTPDGQWLLVGAGVEERSWRSSVAWGALHTVHVPGPRWDLVGSHGWNQLTVGEKGDRFLEEHPMPATFRATHPLRYWKVESSDRQHQLPMLRDGTLAAFSTDGTRVAMATLEPWDSGTFKADRRRDVAVWNLRNLAENPWTVPGGTPLRRGLSPEGDKVVVFSGSSFQIGEIRLFERSKAEPVWAAPTPAPGGHPMGMAVDPAFRYVAMTGPGVVRVHRFEEAPTKIHWEDTWSAEDQSEHRGGSSNLSFEAACFASILDRGRTLVVCHAIGRESARVSSWELETGRKIGHVDLPMVHYDTLQAIHRTWMPASARVILPAEAGYMVWNATTGEEEVQIPDVAPGTGFRGYPVISPDDRLIALPDIGRVHLLSIEDGRNIDELVTETAAGVPIAMAWAPEGHRLVTRGPGYSYLLWDVDAGATI